MELIRFGPAGEERPGVLTGDDMRKDCSAHFDDWDQAFFRNDGLKRLAALLRDRVDDLPEVPADARWGACIPRPGKIICIGLNYSDHAKESGVSVPKEPVIFMKAANTVVGPHDPILIPRGSVKTDWEVELGVVIGKDARYLGAAEESRNYIAGYCISHDVSERSFQLEREGQWTKGKSCDTFNPVGPFLATADEVPNVHELAMSLDVNGERKQTGSTRNMVYDVEFLVHYLSQFMTLEPGDLISTGTPPGVGFGQKPPQYLRAGDVVEMTIAGLGSIRNVCDSA